MTTPDRYTDLSHRVHQRYACGNTFDRHAFDHDPVFRASVENLVKMLTATDEALAAESVNEATRDRVAYRLLYGEAPCSYPVPDSREALARMHDRDEKMQRLLEPPPFRGWLPPREGGYTGGPAGAPPPPPKGHGGVATWGQRP